MSINIDDHIKEERVFLHDLSNKLVIVQGMIELTSMDVEKINDIQDKTIERIKKALKATVAMTDMMRERRDKLKSVVTFD